MKNKLCIMSITLCLAGIIFGFAEQTNVSVQEIESVTERSDCIASEPLVIESTEWAPHGIFEGTIVISGDGISETGYEGIVYIEPDGGKIRISCTGAVRSRYGELF